MQTRILIGADIVPTRSNYLDFIRGDVQNLIGKQLELKLGQMDFTIFNLEVPLTNEVSPIQKCGPNMQASVETITGLKKINPHFFTLANNHILDQGEQGLKTTIELLKREGIGYSGAGENMEKASAPFLFKKNDISFGIYCCAETEFSIATDKTYGANSFDPLESLDHIRKLKENIDYLIVLYHGGKEHYRYPSPGLQRVCRKIVDSGADLVVCQHSHCIGCEENWEKGKIIYGQGNFLFDDSDSEFWQTSLLIEVCFNGKNNHIIKYIPIVKDENHVRMADDKEAKNILEGFDHRSRQITEGDFLEKSYQDFAKDQINEYLRTGIPYSRSLGYRVLKKLTGGKLLLKMLKKEQKLALYNYLICESHRELFVEGLRDILNK